MLEPVDSLLFETEDALLVRLGNEAHHACELTSCDVLLRFAKVLGEIRIALAVNLAHF